MHIRVGSLSWPCIRQMALNQVGITHCLEMSRNILFSETRLVFETRSHQQKIITAIYTLLEFKKGASENSQGYIQRYLDKPYLMAPQKNSVSNAMFQTCSKPRWTPTVFYR